MSPQRRFLVVVVSFALCGPLLLDALRGDVPLASAVARYGLALVLTGAGMRALDRLVSGYGGSAPSVGAAAGHGQAAVEPETPAVERRQPSPVPGDQAADAR